MKKARKVIATSCTPNPQVFERGNLREKFARQAKVVFVERITAVFSLTSTCTQFARPRVMPARDPCHRY